MKGIFEKYQVYRALPFQWCKLKEQIVLAHIHCKDVCLLSGVVQLVKSYIAFFIHFCCVLQEIYGKWQLWNNFHNAKKVTSADKTSTISFNRFLKQRATLRFPQPTKSPDGIACFHSCFKPDTPRKLTSVVSIQKFTIFQRNIYFL